MCIDKIFPPRALYCNIVITSLFPVQPMQFQLHKDLSTLLHARQTQVYQLFLGSQSTKKYLPTPLFNFPQRNSSLKKRNCLLHNKNYLNMGFINHSSLTVSKQINYTYSLLWAEYCKHVLIKILC